MSQRPAPTMTFTGSPLDRQSARRADEDWVAARLADPTSRFLAFNVELKPLIDVDGGLALGWRDRSICRPGDMVVLLGEAQGITYFAVDRPDLEAPIDQAKWIDARSVAMQMRGGDTATMAQAKSLIDWHRRHRFCAVCGAESVATHAGHHRKCSNAACGAEHFPRTDPVVIMLVEHQGDLLLGRQPRFPPGNYSALAGFIEQGESIEEAVRREIHEEAGVPVGEVRYLASQPWPFPSSLMIGCIGWALDRAITIDPTELEDARWFSRAEVTEMQARALDMTAPIRIPPPLSLAHQLIKIWLRGDQK